MAKGEVVDIPDLPPGKLSEDGKIWDVADAFNNAVPHHLDTWLDEEDSELRSEKTNIFVTK